MATKSTRTEGARTGLANLVTGGLFLGALFLTPLFEIVPYEAASPALVVVGFLLMAQVKDILGTVKPDDMDQIQRWTADYVTKFAKVEGKAAQKMFKKLVDDCDLTQEEAAEVINIMPTSLEELRAFTLGWKKLILTETLEKMLNIRKAADNQS